MLSLVTTDAKALRPSLQEPSGLLNFWKSCMSGSNPQVLTDMRSATLRTALLPAPVLATLMEAHLSLALWLLTVPMPFAAGRSSHRLCSCGPHRCCAGLLTVLAGHSRHAQLRDRSG